MEVQDILIRLLKNGSVTDEEFKILYAKTVLHIDINSSLIPSIELQSCEPKIWHGINHPTTGEPLCNPTYTTSK